MLFFGLTWKRVVVGGMGFMILTVTTDVHFLCLGFAMIIPVVIKEAQDETLGDWYLGQNRVPQSLIG
jgi:hypothetical protein